LTSSHLIDYKLNKRLINGVAMRVETEKNQQDLSSRERILKTAVVLFARQGFDRTGLRQLASEADVNLAMVNYFFGSKKKLLTEILDIFFSEYLMIARVELTGDGDLTVRLEKFIHQVVYFFAEKKDYLLIALTDLHHDDPEILEYKAQWGEQMIQIMEEAVCDSSGINIAPKLITPLLTSMMASRFLFLPVVERIEAGGTELPDIEAYSKIITTIFLQGITEK
jgi:AcrR family transcriptional regulator